MTMLTDVDIGSGPCASPRTTSASTTTTTDTATSTPSATWPTTAPLRRQAERSVTADGAQPAPSTSSRMGWSAAAFCSTCPAYAAFPGSSRASMCSATTSKRRSATGGDRGAGRHPARPHRPHAAPGGVRAVGHRQGQGGPSPHDGLVPGRAAAWPRSGRTATTTPPRAPPKGSPSPSTSSRSTRWASTCSTTSSSRTRRAALRGRRAMGVPVRRRSTADRWRDRIADQPHRDLLRAARFERCAL